MFFFIQLSGFIPMTLTREKCVSAKSLDEPGPLLFYNAIFKLNNLDLFQTLMTLTSSKDDADSLKQVSAMITPLQNKLQIAVQQAGPFAKRKPG